MTDEKTYKCYRCGQEAQYCRGKLPIPPIVNGKKHTVFKFYPSTWKQKYKSFIKGQAGKVKCNHKRLGGCCVESDSCPYLENTNGDEFGWLACIHHS